MMGIISSVVKRVRDGQRREFEIREEMYHQEKMKRDYFNTAKCPRARGGGAGKCASCTLAPVCKTGSRCW